SSWWTPAGRKRLPRWRGRSAWSGSGRGRLLPPLAGKAGMGTPGPRLRAVARYTRLHIDFLRNRIGWIWLPPAEWAQHSSQDSPTDAIDPVEGRGRRARRDRRGGRP